MHLILTGATGLVGSAVLDALLKTPAVTQISILSRRPVPMAEAARDPRVQVILHQDFAKYDQDLLRRLKGAAGCVWALGISTTQVGAEDYVKITKTYTLAAAEAFRGLASGSSPSSSALSDDAAAAAAPAPFRFVFVSGLGATDAPGRLTASFARVKGEAELGLAALGADAGPDAFQPSSVRPAGVDEHGHAAILPWIPPRPAAIRFASPAMLWTMRTLWPRMHTPTEPLGNFLVGMAMGKYDEQLIDGTESKEGIWRMKGMPVVENCGFRKLVGLTA